MRSALIVLFVFAATAFAGEPLPLAADHSLSTAEYIAAGAPKPDHAWSAEEFEAAVGVLKKLAAEDATQLPRAGSMRSGLFFRHLVSADNLKLVDDIAAPTEKVPAILALQRSIRDVLTTYIGATNTGHSFDAELIDAMQSLIIYTTRLAEVAEELAGTFTKDDPTYEVRMDGLRQMRGGIIDIASGSIVTLGEKDIYRLRVRLRFAKSLEKLLPPLLAHGTVDGRAQACAEALRMSEDAAVEPEIREAVARIAALLKE